MSKLIISLRGSGLSRIVLSAMMVAVLLAVSPYCGAQTKAPAGDPYPYGAISFFSTQNCPTGWVPFDMGNGRFFIPVMQNGGIGSMVGQPLQSGQNPTHNHSAIWTISLSNASYVGVHGGNNNNVTSDGSKTFSGTTSSDSANIPYVQLLACLKQGTPTQEQIPSGVVSFFGTIFCPSGWSTTYSSAGRFPVGLPPNGAVGATFGGDPLLPQEDRTHTHGFNGSVSTNSGGVGLASGCCAQGYGLSGSYGFTGTTAASSSGIPYIVLLQCQKN